jgi:hypothetical protein
MTAAKSLEENTAAFCEPYWRLAEESFVLLKIDPFKRYRAPPSVDTYAIEEFDPSRNEEKDKLSETGTKTIC